MKTRLAFSLAALAIATSGFAQETWINATHDHSIFPPSHSEPKDPIQKHAMAFVDKASEFIETKNYRQAEKLARKGLELLDEKAEPYKFMAELTLADVLLREGKNSEALAILRNSRSGMGTYASYGRIGLLHLRLGEVEKSNAIWGKAFLEYRSGRLPDLVPPVKDKASLEAAWLLLIANNEGFYNKTTPLYYCEEAVKVLPNDFATQMSLGAYYVHVERYSAALQVLGKALGYVTGSEKQLAIQFLHKAKAQGVRKFFPHRCSRIYSGYLATQPHFGNQPPAKPEACCA